MSFSRLNEEAVIEQLIAERPEIVRECVDIGASYGAIWSNVWKLLLNGWKGLLVECNPDKFPSLIKACEAFPGTKVLPVKASPDNVSTLITESGMALDFGVLSLDIDGYDYHVLKSLLKTHRPQIVCLEINTCIPPPIRFSVKHDSDYWWEDNTFFGMSIQAAYDLLAGHGYKIRNVCDDNVIFSFFGDGLDLVQAWNDGFLNNGNKTFGHDISRKLGSMTQEQAHECIQEMWAKYKGRFDLW